MAEEEIVERYPGDIVGLRCTACGGPAVCDGYYYEIDGEALCIDCVDRLYRKETAMGKNGCRCDVCGGCIAEDEQYYEIAGDILCSFCMDMLYQKEAS